MAQFIIDLINNGGGVQPLLYPQTLAATTQGTSYNAQNLDVSTNAIISFGTVTANTTNIVVQIEEFTSGGVWQVIPNMVANAVTGSGSSNTQQILRGQRTWSNVRANAVTVQGTTPSAACAVTLVSQGKFLASGGLNYGSGVDKYPSS